MDITANATLNWLQEYAHYGILTTDSELIIRQWNQWLSSMSGLSAEEVIGRGLTEVFPHLVERSLHLAYTNALQGQVTVLSPRLHAWLLPFPNNHQDSPFKQMQQSVRIAPLRDGEKVIGTITVIEDVTERESRNQALVIARDAAEAAGQAKAQFLANMSHEIRTPLNAIIGCANLLNDTELDDEQRDFVSILQISSESLLSLINDILDYSKIEAGRLELDEEIFSLEDCAAEAMDLVARKAAEKGLELLFFVDKSIPELAVGDQGRVRQIIINLLNNAVKFTHEGEIALNLSAEQEGDSWLARIEVRDTGIGIAPDQASRLFESFTQADASTTRRYGGTGLGLAISRQLAMAMDGDIHLQSEPGVGSTFVVELRLQASDLQVNMDSPAVSDILEGRRVLIVDDNATNRWILSRQLRAWGMEPTAVESAQDALALLAKEPDTFDICLLDVQMPDMDGIELAAHINRLHDSRQLPVLLLTSVDTISRELAHLQLAGYLHKPVRPSHLRFTLHEVFSQAAPSKAGKTQKEALFDKEMGVKFPLRVLLAEDNRVNQRVALRILQRLGYQADLAENGRVALEAVAHQPYDLVLMDIQMPEMDGLIATEQIREQIDPESQPHIVAMTAHALLEERKTIEQADINGYISKPIDLAELVAVLQRVYTERHDH